MRRRHRLVTADPDDRVASDCESVQVSALGTRCTASRGTVRMSKSGAIRVRVFCAVAGKGKLQLQSVAQVRTGKAKAQGLEDRKQVVLAQGGSAQGRHREGLEGRAALHPAQEAAQRAWQDHRQDRRQGKGRDMKASSVFTVKGPR